MQGRSSVQLPFPRALAALAAAALLACAGLGERTDEGRLAPLLANIGELHHRITAADPMAQRFFDQGLTLEYGFNHLEALRSFQEAARIDPGCAMCFFGQALAQGPNINDPAPDEERERRAFAAIQRARELSGSATAAERDFIEALATRHSDDPAMDRGELNESYAEAMAQLHARYPEDPDVAVIYAASIMNTMPWDYWAEDGSPRPGTETLVATLEAVMARHPEHPGANHYYIHAVEASQDPDRAVSAADRLGGLVPVAGHLVHMPSHIYIRVGRYQDAVEANLRAIDADEDYVTQCRAQGIYPVAYYPHNIHFLWAALSMDGQAGEALVQARKVASKHEDHHMHQRGFGFPHLLRAVPLFTLLRFGRWDELLAEPEPAGDLPFVRGIRHFARGMARVARDESGLAQAELEALEALLDRPVLEELKIWDANSLAQLLGIARHMLAGELAAQRGDFEDAIARLERAVALEDALVYSEPRDWPLPVRHVLGAVLLEAGRPDRAEAVYREDLEQHRDNGWGLLGLSQSLAAQGRSRESAAARRRFETAWLRADAPLRSSRY